MLFKQEGGDYQVAAVCGNQVLVFGETHGNRRPLKYVQEFPHYGAALAWAIEFDEKQRR